ncbi:MAG: hypothetical protein H6728_12125 [Myxococcales bacterium]|nr:hypothetical protein [Myxococcales bacterium]
MQTHKSAMQRCWPYVPFTLLGGATFSFGALYGLASLWQSSVWLAFLFAALVTCSFLFFSQQKPNALAPHKLPQVASSRSSTPQATAPQRTTPRSDTPQSPIPWASPHPLASSLLSLSIQRARKDPYLSTKNLQEIELWDFLQDEISTEIRCPAPRQHTLASFVYPIYELDDATTQLDHTQDKPAPSPQDPLALLPRLAPCKDIQLRGITRWHLSDLDAPTTPDSFLV